MLNKSRNTGITLIALVVSIIVLLILAGISISMLSGDNGLLTKAGEAKERTGTAQEEESAKLTFTEVQMELAQGKTVESDQFQKMVDGNFGTGNATGTIGGNTYIITVARTGINYQMDSNGKIGTLAELPIDFNPGELEKSGDTYTINSIEDLVAFSYNVNSGIESYEGKTVTLGRDLDFQNDNSYVDATSKYKKDDNGYIPDNTSATTIKSFMTDKSGVGFISVGSRNNNSFKGSFNGNEKYLSNLYMNSTYGGLFEWVNAEVEISNLSINSCNITGIADTATFVAINEAKLILTNCHSSGTIKSMYNYAGGIIGSSSNNSNLTLNSCTNNSEVTGYSQTGGIVGFTDASTPIVIINSYNNGKIKATNGGGVGGILGKGSARISNCYNSADLQSNGNGNGGIIGNANSNTMIINCYNTATQIVGGFNAGGIAGTISSNSMIVNCYNNSDINGASSLSGGILGYIDSNTNEPITNCYNFKSVTVSDWSLAGGISGQNGTITNCYNIGTIKTEGSNPVGGIVGANAIITNSHNSGTVIGGNASCTGEIIGAGSVDNTNNYLAKEDGNNANANGATPKSQSEMDEIMSVQNFVNTMNSYVSTNNSDSSKTKLKTWKVENGLPVFAE